MEFTLLDSQTIDIKIYDLSGKLVITLINEEKQANFYQISLAGLQLSSGVYFSKLTTNKGFSLVKKLVVK